MFELGAQLITGGRSEFGYLYSIHVADVPALRAMLAEIAVLILSTEMATALLMFEKGFYLFLLLSLTFSEQ